MPAQAGEEVQGTAGGGLQACERKTVGEVCLIIGQSHVCLAFMTQLASIVEFADYRQNIQFFTC